MPWKERSVMEERMRFVLRLKDGGIASLCCEFGISRITGYKIYDRYKECRLEGLTDRARTPTATPIRRREPKRPGSNSRKALISRGFADPLRTV